MLRRSFDRAWVTFLFISEILKSSQMNCLNFKPGNIADLFCHKTENHDSLRRYND